MIDNKIPTIRFEGFSEAWEMKNLGEVLTSLHNGQTPSRANPKFWGGDINWLTSGELNRDIVYDTYEKITPEGQKAANLKTVPKGTVVIAITGLEAAGTRGSCAKLGLDTTLNQSCMALITNRNSLDSLFLFQWYLKIGNEYGIRYTQGTKQQSYNAELIKKLPIKLPCIKEQKMIADFIGEIGDQITLQQRQIELLKESKQGFLQKMFPQDGERVPEVRLDGFSGEWEVCKFDNFISKAGKKNSSGKDYPPFSVSNKLGLVRQSEQFEDGRLGHLDKKAYKLVNTDEFAYNPARINVGSIAFNDLDSTVIVSSLYVVIKMSDKINNNYILQFIKSDKFNREVKKNTEGSVREYLFYDNFKNIKFPYPPTYNEQQTIGEFFKQFDDNIALHEKELELLKETKKGFLQKMFV